MVMSSRHVSSRTTPVSGVLGETELDQRLSDARPTVLMRLPVQYTRRAVTWYHVMSLFAYVIVVQYS